MGRKKLRQSETKMTTSKHATDLDANGVSMFRNKA